MTVEEYRAVGARIPFSQLIDGVLVVGEAKPIHGVVQGRLIAALGAWTEQREGRGLVSAPLGVEISEFDHYEPDLVWLAEAHVPEDLTVELARMPELVVEVRSPSTWRFDVGHKKHMYEARAVPELWLVDPYEQVVRVHRRSTAQAVTYDVELRLGPDDSLESPQLPGFLLSLSALFG